MLALETLAWGLFFGLACLCLAPVFSSGKLEQSIRWVLIVAGIMSLFAVVGQVIGSNGMSFNPFTFAGMMGWGSGLTTAVALMVIWFRKQ
jgi:hypothetical protein